MDDTPLSYVPQQSKCPPQGADYDDNSRDVNDTSVFVATQDSQGQTVMTKATPLHMKELGIAPNHQAGTSKSSAGDAYPSRERVSRPTTTKQSSHTSVVDLNKVKFIDGMEDLPPPAFRKPQQKSLPPKEQRAGPPARRLNRTSTAQPPKSTATSSKPVWRELSEPVNYRNL